MALGDGASWDETVPTDSTVANQIDDYNRDLRVGVRGRMAREHIWPSSQSATNEAGHHNYITLQPQAASPAVGGTTAGVLCALTTGSGYALVYKKSGGSDITLVNSEGNLPIITTGTQGGVVMASSANPSGVIVIPAATTADYVLTSQTTTGPAEWKSASSVMSSVLGTWSTTADSAVVTATADTLVVVVLTADANSSKGLSKGWTDTSNPPTTQVGGARVRRYDGSSQDFTDASYSFPVKNGENFKVTLSDTAGTVTQTIRMIPLGV